MENTSKHFTFIFTFNIISQLSLLHAISIFSIISFIFSLRLNNEKEVQEKSPPPPPPHLRFIKDDTKDRSRTYTRSGNVSLGQMYEHPLRPPLTWISPLASRGCKYLSVRAFRAANIRWKGGICL